MILCLSVFSLSTQHISAAKTSTYEQTYNAVLEEYMADPMFQLHYKENPEGALEMIDIIVEQRMNKKPIGNKPMGGTYDEAYCYVPNIKQAETYFCGPASVLQALYGFNAGNRVPGNNYDEKQYYLANNMSTNPTDGTYVYKMVDELNKYSSRKYVYVNAGSLSETQILDYITTSLINDRPAILHAQTKGLKYYNGKSLGHYITAFGTDRYNKQVALSDCHYNDLYFGVHVVSLSEVKAALPSGRYLIYAP